MRYEGSNRNLRIRIRGREQGGNLEKYAAEELGRLIGAVFGQPADMSFVPDNELSGALPWLLLTSGDAEVPDPALRAFDGAAMKDEQIYAIRPEPEAAFLTGGSPAALLWAVYELVETWGVVYTLQEDVLPAEPPDRIFPESEIRREPRQRIRSWRLMNEWYIGPTSWTIAQQTRTIRQLAKLRFNGIYLGLWPHQPFVDFASDSVQRSTTALNFGIGIPLDADNIGRELLPPGETFVNPEFAGCRTFDEWREAGKQYTSEIVGLAKFFGMRVSIAIQPFDLPKEFAPLLENPVQVHQVGFLSIAEEGNLYNDAHLRLLSAQLDAYLEAYGDADEFEIGLPEHARSAEAFDEAWQELDGKFGLSARHDIGRLLHDAELNDTAAGGAERAVEEGRMTLVMLNALHKVLHRTNFLARLQRSGKRLSITLGLSCPAILPVVADAMWPDGILRIVVGYTSSRASRTLRALDRLEPGAVEIQQILTLQDDNVGALPQLCTSSIARLLEFACERRWTGYVLRFWPLGDLDPMTAYLARASWQEGLTPEAEHLRFAAALFGEAAAPAVVQAYRLMEDATLLLDIELGILLPDTGIITRRMGPGRTISPPLLDHAANAFAEAKARLRLAGEAGIAAGGRSHHAYALARLSFAIRTLAGLKRVEAGNRSLAAGKRNEALVRYGEAIAEFRTALAHTATCVRDDSDRAILAAYYDLLVREPERAVRDP